MKIYLSYYWYEDLHEQHIDVPIITKQLSDEIEEKGCIDGIFRYNHIDCVHRVLKYGRPHTNMTPMPWYLLNGISSNIS